MLILGAVPRIVLASISAYFCGEFANSFVLSKMKYWSGGRRGLSQAWRFVASTIVGEGLDSVVFMVIAFAGALSGPELVQTTLSLYVFKVAYEVLATPLSTAWVSSSSAARAAGPVRTILPPSKTWIKSGMM